MRTTNQNRRRFISALGATAAATCLPTAQASTVTPPRAALSLPHSQLAAHYDVLVIGSGYGGAVMAARLATGRKLAILERGREWQPPEFPDSLPATLSQFRSSALPLGLFDYRTGATLDVLSGNGLGGTSLINANVLISPDRDLFSRWPAAIQNAYASGAMDVYEARVRAMLAADMVTPADALRKNWFHLSLAKTRQRQSAGALPRPLPIAVNLRRFPQLPNEQGVWQAACTHCGDCVTGCRVGAKNTLDVNYLPLARSAGAEIYVRMEVEWVEKLADGSWRVHVQARPADGAPVRRLVTARHVILAAGALGSTQILLRSRAQGLQLSPALGTRFSANGDLLGMGYNTSVQSNIVGTGDGPALAGMARTGPTITAAADYRANRAVESRFLIEEAAIPSALADALRLAMPLAAGAMPDFSASQRMGRDVTRLRADGALNHSTVFLGIGHDSASGRVQLDAAGTARVVWPGLPQEPFVARMRSEMAQLSGIFKGKYVDSPRSSPVFGGALTTVHPLGGCPMGDRGEDAVVNADGQVYNPAAGSLAVHDGLWISDGSIIPGSLGANPMLTIAALAERAAERFPV